MWVGRCAENWTHSHELSSPSWAIRVGVVTKPKREGRSGKCYSGKVGGLGAFQADQIFISKLSQWTWKLEIRKLRTKFPQLCYLIYKYEDIYQLDFFFPLRIMCLVTTFSRAKKVYIFQNGLWVLLYFSLTMIIVWQSGVFCFRFWVFFFFFTISMIIEDRALAVSLSPELWGCPLLWGHPL